MLDEPESTALETWLQERRQTRRLSSELARAELVRGARRVDPNAITAALAVVNGLNLIPVSTSVLETAATVGSATLRTLDALHLATALLLRAEISDFVSYDPRLALAAAAGGIEVASPGAPP